MAQGIGNLQTTENRGVKIQPLMYGLIAISPYVQRGDFVDQDRVWGASILLRPAGDDDARVPTPRIAGVQNSIEVVISIGHIDHMKVMSAELKTHLGKYLREVEQNRITLEVCLRDRTVAYLVPAIGPLPVATSHSPREALSLVGMRLDTSSPRRAKARISPPVLAGDGREDVSSVAVMRGDRDW